MKLYGLDKFGGKAEESKFTSETFAEFYCTYFSMDGSQLQVKVDAEAGRLFIEFDNFYCSNKALLEHMSKHL